MKLALRGNPFHGETRFAVDPTSTGFFYLVKQITFNMEVCKMTYFVIFPK